MQHAESTPFVGIVGRSIRQFIPGIQTFLHYQRTDFSADLLAGLSVATVCLPVGIAYSEV